MLVREIIHPAKNKMTVKAASGSSSIHNKAKRMAAVSKAQTITILVPNLSHNLPPIGAATILEANAAIATRPLAVTSTANQRMVGTVDVKSSRILRIEVIPAMKVDGQAAIIYCAPSIPAG